MAEEYLDSLGNPVTSSTIYIDAPRIEDARNFIIIPHQESPERFKGIQFSTDSGRKREILYPSKSSPILFPLTPQDIELRSHQLKSQLTTLELVLTEINQSCSQTEGSRVEEALFKYRSGLFTDIVIEQIETGRQGGDL